MELDPFSGMVGLTLDGMKRLPLLDRSYGKLELWRYGERWVLLHLPRGRFKRKPFYLMAEKSRRPRLFVTADTAIGVVSTLTPLGVYVNFCKRISVIENKV